MIPAVLFKTAVVNAKEDRQIAGSVERNDWKITEA